MQLTSCSFELWQKTDFIRLGHPPHFCLSAMGPLAVEVNLAGKHNQI